MLWCALHAIIHTAHTRFSCEKPDEYLGTRGTNISNIPRFGHYDLFSLARASSRPCTIVPTCIDTSDASVCPQYDHPYRIYTFLGRITRRIPTRGTNTSYVPGLANSTCFHMHGLRAAVYGRADLHRHIEFYGVPSVRSPMPLMHVSWASN